jgi:hypothetical protein
MHVQAQSWVLPNVFDVGNAVKQLTWTRMMRQHFVVSSIGSRDVACADRPNIRRFEHFL